MVVSKKPKGYLRNQEIDVCLFQLLVFDANAKEVPMNREKDNWLDKYAVTCRVFKGRWSIRHCLRIYSEIKDLKIEMSTRGRRGAQR